MKPKKNIWLWIALIVVLLAIAKYATSSWRKYQVWQDHKAYFEQAPENRKIETWMTPNFVKRHYKLDLDSLLSISPSFWEERKPLSELCTSHKLDCDELLTKLNSHIHK